VAKRIVGENIPVKPFGTPITSCTMAIHRHRSATAKAANNTAARCSFHSIVKRMYLGLTLWHLAFVAIGACMVSDVYRFRRKLMMQPISDASDPGQQAVDIKRSYCQVMRLAFASAVGLM
jgi:hypothetical protein